MQADSSTQAQGRTLSKEERKEIDKLLPVPMWMADLVRPIEAWAVRMKRFDKTDNQVFGAMVWPEVLLCETQGQAEGLRKFLDDASFQDYMESVREEDPEAETQDHKYRWRETDIAQYVVEHVPDISLYAEINRVGESLSTIRRLFPTLEGIAALRRYR